MRAGDPVLATRLAAEAHEHAVAVGAPRALSRAARAVAVVAGRLGPLEEAIGLLRPTGLRLELAAALADLGSAQRRAGRTTSARELLREAGTIAEACGARPLVQQAHAELVAAGGRRVADRPVHGPLSLTPTERRIADLAVTGMSNAEVARDLVVSVKTVEWHLGRAYRKLGIVSRRELRDALVAPRREAS